MSTSGPPSVEWSTHYNNIHLILGFALNDAADSQEREDVMMKCIEVMRQPHPYQLRVRLFLLCAEAEDDEEEAREWLNDAKSLIRALPENMVTGKDGAEHTALVRQWQKQLKRELRETGDEVGLMTTTTRLVATQNAGEGEEVMRRDFAALQLQDEGGPE